MRANSAVAFAAGCGLLVLSLAPAFAGEAGAGRVDRRARQDAHRFGLDRPPAASGPTLGLTHRGRAAIQAFNAAHRGRFNLRYGKKSPAASPERRMTQLGAKDAAELFLREHGADLGFKPGELRLDLARSGAGVHHLLFEQVVQGVPVEFSRVKVHVDQNGEVVALQSSYRPVTASPVPGIGEAAAAAAVAADLGGAPPRSGTLVFYPMADGPARLAWKFQVRGGWVYYVDAQDGRVLFRYSTLVRQCTTAGVVTGNVFDFDPADPSNLIAAVRPIENQKVYVYVQNDTAYEYTHADGSYCSSRSGRIIAGLQGKYVTVSNFAGPSAHYDNGQGRWRVHGTTISSPSPYPDNAVLTSLVSVTPADEYDGMTAVKIAPYFSRFQVGAASIEDNDLNISDNDQVAILDSEDNVVATYVRPTLFHNSNTSFIGAAVPGMTYKLRLKSNESGNGEGYSVSLSSYLVLTDANRAVPDPPTGTFTWGPGHMDGGRLDEVNVFYQLNLMHDYLVGGPDADLDANIDWPLPVMVRVGPGVANAFYDPLHKNISIGDGNGGSFAKDPTVVRHEYVHFMVDQIYPIINFGQNGAISEAVADYFAASSLDTSYIGGYAGGLDGGAMRDLHCLKPLEPATHDHQTLCKKMPGDWTGTVHEDSIILSAGLWRLRETLSQPVSQSGLGSVDGPKCADGLVFQALLYFPDSFQEFHEAMDKAYENHQVPACGSALDIPALVEGELGTYHGIHTYAADAQDPYEPNDGIQTATDISTRAAIAARIYPEGDIDYYAFGAGAGRVKLTLKLPPESSSYNEYRAFSLNLVDRHFKVVRTANPTVSNPTLGGYCPESNCLTYDKEVVIDYDNPSPGQLFVMVSAPPGDQSNVSKNYCLSDYTLLAEYNRGAVDTGVISAVYDKDLLSFSVNVATNVRTQNFTFDHARLRDHSLNVLPQTSTAEASPYLAFVSSSNALGRVSGTLRLTQGFHSRFPAVGTVHLEIFGKNDLGTVQTLGFSQPVNLTSNRVGLTAWNNVFNPMRGEKTTIKYETLEAGNVKLTLHTLSGNLVLNLLDGYQPAGQGSVDWTGRNSAGETVASGIYLLHMDGPGVSETKKVIVVK